MSFSSGSVEPSVIGGAEPENQDVDPTSRNANAPESSGACVWEWLVYLLNVSVCIWTLELVIPESTLL